MTGGGSGDAGRQTALMKVPYVIDNQSHRLADVLRELLAGHSRKSLDMATAYFTVAAFGMLTVWESLDSESQEVFPFALRSRLLLVASRRAISEKIDRLRGRGRRGQMLTAGFFASSGTPSRSHFLTRRR